MDGEPIRSSGAAEGWPGGAAIGESPLARVSLKWVISAIRPETHLDSTSGRGATGSHVSGRDIFDALTRAARRFRPPPIPPAPERLRRPSLERFADCRRRARPVLL